MADGPSVAEDRSEKSRKKRTNRRHAGHKRHRHRAAVGISIDQFGN
jgi:hypothetical protein